MTIRKSVLALPFHVVPTFLAPLVTSFLLIAAHQTEGRAPQERAAAPIALAAGTSYIRDACGVTASKDLCYQTLSIYASSVKSNPWKLCNRATWLSYQAALNVSRTLSGLSKTQLDEPSVSIVRLCVDVVKMGTGAIRQAMKEGRHVPDPSDYAHPATNFDDAVNTLSGCNAYGSYAEPSEAVMAVIGTIDNQVIPLTNNARDLCYS